MPREAALGRPHADLVVEREQPSGVGEPEEADRLVTGHPEGVRQPAGQPQQVARTEAQQVVPRPVGHRPGQQVEGLVLVGVRLQRRGRPRWLGDERDAEAARLAGRSSCSNSEPIAQVAGPVPAGRCTTVRGAGVAGAVATSMTPLPRNGPKGVRTNISYNRPRVERRQRPWLPLPPAGRRRRGDEGPGRGGRPGGVRRAGVRRDDGRRRGPPGEGLARHRLRERRPQAPGRARRRRRDPRRRRRAGRRRAALLRPGRPRRPRRPGQARDVRRRDGCPRAPALPGRRGPHARGRGRPGLRRCPARPRGTSREEHAAAGGGPAGDRRAAGRPGRRRRGRPGVVDQRRGALRLLRRRGWSTERYVAHLTDLWTRVLLADPHATPAPGGEKA